MPDGLSYVGYAQRIPSNAKDARQMNYALFILIRSNVFYSW